MFKFLPSHRFSPYWTGVSKHLESWSFPSRAALAFIFGGGRETLHVHFHASLQANVFNNLRASRVGRLTDRFCPRCLSPFCAQSKHVAKVSLPFFAFLLNSSLPNLRCPTLCGALSLGSCDSGLGIWLRGQDHGRRRRS